MYRMVDCGTWDDPWFESLAPQGKLLFLYLLTNPRSTSCGAFEITPRKMAFETGLPLELIEKFLKSWAPRVQWWPEHQIVFLKNFYRRQTNSERMRINAARLVADMPLAVREAIYMEYPELLPDAHTLSIPYPDPIDKQNRDRDVTETETKQDETGTESADAPPRQPKRASALSRAWIVCSELRRWAVSQGFSGEEIDRETEKFRDHFAANGKTMKDWDAAWKNWMRRSREFVPARAGPAPVPRSRGEDPNRFLALTTPPSPTRSVDRDA